MGVHVNWVNYGIREVLENEPRFKRYRKKPVTIWAYQTDEEKIIHTKEGDMKADVGDWIILGVKGEQYPCKPDIFAITYDKVE